MLACGEVVSKRVVSAHRSRGALACQRGHTATNGVRQASTRKAGVRLCPNER